MKQRKIILRSEKLTRSRFEAGKWYIGKTCSILGDWTYCFLGVADDSLADFGIKAGTLVATDCFGEEVALYAPSGEPNPRYEFVLYNGQVDLRVTRIYTKGTGAIINKLLHIKQLDKQ